MLKQILAASLCTLICSSAFADAPAADSTAPATSLSITGPQEVGTTTMPPGNYVIKEQTTGNSYDLMVSNKGTMILAPAPAAGSAAASAAAAPASTQSGLTGLGTSAVKKMVQEQMTKGVTNVIEKDAASSLGKFMK
jgi:hypothetical protein